MATKIKRYDGEKVTVSKYAEDQLEVDGYSYPDTINHMGTEIRYLQGTVARLLQHLADGILLTEDEIRRSCRENIHTNHRERPYRFSGTDAGRR